MGLLFRKIITDDHTTYRMFQAKERLSLDRTKEITTWERGHLARVKNKDKIVYLRGQDARAPRVEKEIIQLPH